MAMAELDPAVETMTSIWILACEASDKTIRAPNHPSFLSHPSQGFAKLTHPHVLVIYNLIVDGHLLYLII
jgi:hypothetical protein